MSYFLTPVGNIDFLFGNGAFQCLDDFHFRGEGGSRTNDHKFHSFWGGNIELFECSLTHLHAKKSKANHVVMDFLKCYISCIKLFEMPHTL